jgi:TPR repeat protein
MKRLTATICLTLAVLLGSAGMSWSVGLQKGLDAYKNKNYATALRELKPLAEQGYADAQYNLGQMYRRGQGVQQADKTAVKWYRLSAEQGHAFAQTNLGVMYARGQGVIQDNVYAYMWGNLSASNGNEIGGKLRDMVARKMTPAQIADAQKLTRECIRKKYKGC